MDSFIFHGHYKEMINVNDHSVDSITLPAKKAKYPISSIMSIFFMLTPVINTQPYVILAINTVNIGKLLTN